MLRFYWEERDEGRMGKNLIAKEEHKANVMLEQQGMEGMHF